MQVSIVEDHPETAEYLISMLRDSDALQFHRWYKTGEEVLREIFSDQADVFIVDIGLPHMSGVELIARIRAQRENAKIIMHTVFEDEELLLSAIENGADGYLLKDLDTSRIVAEISSVAQGGFSLTAGVAKRILQKYSRGGRPEIRKERNRVLTEREIEILNFVALGLKQKDIAEELDISFHTVRRHIESIYQKLKVTNRIQALRAAKRLDLIQHEIE